MEKLSFSGDPLPTMPLSEQAFRRFDLSKNMRVPQPEKFMWLHITSSERWRCAATLNDFVKILPRSSLFALSTTASERTSFVMHQVGPQFWIGEGCLCPVFMFYVASLGKPVAPRRKKERKHE